MNEPKHTAGPWSSSAWGKDAMNVIVARGAGGDEIPVVVLLENGLAPEVVAANRRLIKAVPLLWDACVAALGHLGGEGDDNPGPALAAVCRAVKEAAGQVDVDDGDLWRHVNPDREGDEE